MTADDLAETGVVVRDSQDFILILQIQRKYTKLQLAPCMLKGVGFPEMDLA